MGWSSRDTYNLRRTAKQLSRNYRPITLLIPTETGTSNHDQVLDSSLDASDTSTTVTGQNFSWKAQIIFVRLGGPTFTDLMMAGPANYDKGELTVFIKPVDLPAFNQMLSDPDGYFYLDGETYRPYGGTDKAGVYRNDELRASCTKVTPRVRATGY
jgi:hypothetical protein